MSHAAEEEVSSWGKDGKVDLFKILTCIKQILSCFILKMHLVIITFKEGRKLTDILGDILVKYMEGTFMPLVCKDCDSAVWHY